MDERVVGDAEHPLVELSLGRQLAVQQEVGDLEERRVLGQLLDGVAAVLEDAVIAVDVGDGATAGGRIDEPWVVGRQPRLRPRRRSACRSAARIVPSVIAISYSRPVRLSRMLRESLGGLNRGRIGHAHNLRAGARPE